MNLGFWRFKAYQFLCPSYLKYIMTIKNVILTHPCAMCQRRWLESPIKYVFHYMTLSTNKCIVPHWDVHLIPIKRWVLKTK